jgi:purine-nucleoside phosphorylase
MDETSARARLHNWNAKVAIILGSGLGGIVQNPIESIAYAEFAEIPEPRVPGHAGKFSLSEISDVRVIFAQGRAHLYEGFSAHEVTAGVRLLAGAGVSKLIVSNAAGAANDEFKPGDWMMISDHLNLTGTSPLIGAPKFLDLTDAYSARWQKVFTDAALNLGFELRQGVYVGVLGPEYETAAEIGMLLKLGADAVGMSTVLEVIQARALGMEVAGFSCITNLATGLSAEKLSHEEVLGAGTKAAEDFARLLAGALPKL